MAKNQSILFIEGTDGFIPKAIIKKLIETGFPVICVPDELDAIALHRNQSEMILYYLSQITEQAQRTTQYLLELCHTEHKTLCLAGEQFQIARAKELEGSDLIYSCYQRPVNIDQLVEDMKHLSDSHDEFHRTKSILVIDDDSDFLQVTSRWLKYDYKVDSVRSGSEALNYLANLRPDLILLDYEMPELDGYEVLDQIRKNPLTSQIPIIFLTGKNDKETVMRIIKRKPDGYLLKSMGKEELLDALDRFFTNAILTQKTSQHL